MHIALVTYSTRPRGGVVHTLALAEALARSGQAVTVYSLGRGGDTRFFRSVDPAVALRVVPLPDVGPDETVGQRVLRSIAVLSEAFDPSGFDVVHAEDCISANAVPRPIRTVHHIDQFETPELVRCHERAIREPIAHVCVSVAVADELKRDWGIEATVIPNGVDSERFAAAAGPDPVATAARRVWHDLIGAPYVLTVGGIEPRKGTIDLIKAWPSVRTRWPDVRLVIAGGETLFDYRSYRAAFDQVAADLGVQPVILGPVDHDTLPALVAGAAVFAFPSVKEGFGLAALEAASAGVPLVVRDLPVLRQVLGRAAIYARDPATLADGLVRAGRNPDPRAVADGRRAAASFSWDRAAEAHLALYARLSR